MNFNYDIERKLEDMYVELSESIYHRGGSANAKHVCWERFPNKKYYPLKGKIMSRDIGIAMITVGSMILGVGILIGLYVGS